MKNFRKKLAIAIDGGGIRGVVVTRALAMLEEHLGQPLAGLAGVAAGTSTGSIISAGLGAGLTAVQMHELYLALGSTIFKKSWRTFFWPLTRFRYPSDTLLAALRAQIGPMNMGDFWDRPQPMDVVITVFDLLEHRSRFIKPYKREYRDWPVATAVLASSSVPTYFPVVEGRYVDGGVGSYANPCYLAAYETLFCLHWKPEETTLISLGTGRDPHAMRAGEPERYQTWDWLSPLVDAFLVSASDQQVNLVENLFPKLDFRRYQVDMHEKIEMDSPKSIPKLVEYGEQMGRMILNDEYDQAMHVRAEMPPANRPIPT